ncbi:hypothetical protein GH714_017457 [Hevea brasiliensis]|uniref:Uncharacterized protein n=1 Tax=Hevea brasiliensis TaxID=3981 RepID=A0A6A6N542_HEVBR|nr:hypothetical protein GH714_017457 [Hevea brasiliensis]
MKRYEDDSDDSTTISSPDLLQFPSLSEFHCVDCPNLSLIPQFPSLDEELELRKDLEFLPPDGLHNLTSLQQLDWSCPRLTSLPQEMRSLTSLRELTISGCPLLSERCADKKGEDWPFISHIPNVEVDGKRIQWEGCYLLEDEEKSSTTSDDVKDNYSMHNKFSHSIPWGKSNKLAHQERGVPGLLFIYIPEILINWKVLNKCNVLSALAGHASIHCILYSRVYFQKIHTQGILVHIQVNVIVSDLVLLDFKNFAWNFTCAHL